MDGVNRFDGKSVSGAPRPQQLAAASGTCGVAVMAKASAPGRTKTRLVPPLTFDEAAALNTAFLRDVADNLLAAARHAAIAGYAAYAPPGSEGFFRGLLPPAIGLIDAWLPNFGDCLFRTIGEILARGHGSAVVLNSDSPTLPTAFLVETAEMLARPGERAVLGPSSDGGYYLLGLKTAHRRLFDDIAWSTERVAGADAGARARHRARRSHAAGLVRRRRHRRLAPACRRGVSAALAAGASVDAHDAASSGRDRFVDAAALGRRRIHPPRRFQASRERGRRGRLIIAMVD